MKTQFWMGTEDSFQAYEKAVPLAEAKHAEYLASGDGADTPDFPPLYERVGDVGVIKIWAR